MTAARMLSKNIISCYCNNFAITSSCSAWKLCVHIPEIKFGRTVWIFREKIENLLSGAHIFHTTSYLVISSQDKNGKVMHQNIKHTYGACTCFFSVNLIGMLHSHSHCRGPCLRSLF